MLYNIIYNLTYCSKKVLLDFEKKNCFTVSYCKRKIKGRREGGSNKTVAVEYIKCEG